MKKKYFIIATIIIIILGITMGIINVMSSHLFNLDGSIYNNDNILYEHLKNLEDGEEKKNQIYFWLQCNDITEEQAQELLNSMA